MPVGHNSAADGSAQDVQPAVDEFRFAVDHIPGLLWSSHADGYVDFLNLRWLEYTGMSHERAIGWGWQEALHPGDLPSLLQVWQQLLFTQSAGECEARLRRFDGVYRWYLFRATPVFDMAGALIKWYGQTTDIDDFKQAEALLAGEKRLLEMFAQSSPLHATLEAMCRMVDHMVPGAVSSVSLLSDDAVYFSELIAPGLPSDITDRRERSPISERAGPCSVAAYERRQVIVQDILQDQRWNNFAVRFAPIGLRSCYSTPILSSDGSVLGTFALQTRTPGKPTDHQQKIIDHFTHLTAVAIESKRTDAALRESEERFRRMAETTLDVIWITDLHPEVVRYVSPSFEQIWGESVDALYRDARLWTQLIHPDDAVRVFALFNRGIQADGVNRYDTEYRIVRADGTIRWIYERAVFIPDEQGEAKRVSGISTDITERKMTEAALRESQERFSLAVAASADGIWDWDIRSDALFISERAQLIFGLEIGTGITVRPRAQWRQLIKLHSDDAEPYTRLLDAYLSGAVPVLDGEWRVQHPDGAFRWIRVRGLGVRDTDGKATRLAGSVSDIDTQKRTEAALEKSRRLEAMGTLAGGIAHDFNNILGVILGYGEMGMQHTRKGSRLRRSLENIMSAGDRGRSLVDRILSFSRSGIGERRPVHVEEVVNEALNLIAATLPADIRIETTLDADRAAMMGDATQVHQVVMNLIINAIQAMPDGGALRVSLRPQHLPHPHITTTGMIPAGSYLLLRVADSGCGIEADVLDRIFDPFFTTKDVGVGTGLGLSLVHGIVTDVGGAVDVSSAVGIGSIFTVYLPQTGEVEHRRATRTPALPRGAGQRVLIVDDEELLVRLAAEILTDLGYRPICFNASIAALAAFHDDPSQFDAMLTDDRMPGMSGFALIAAIRSMRPDLPILMMTGFIEETASRKTQLESPDAILKKPLSATELAQGLHGILARRLVE